jgi:hypothetical protein
MKLKPVRVCCAAGLNHLQQMDFIMMSYTIVPSWNPVIVMHLCDSLTEWRMVLLEFHAYAANQDIQVTVSRNSIYVIYDINCVV